MAQRLRIKNGPPLEVLILGLLPDRERKIKFYVEKPEELEKHNGHDDRVIARILQYDGIEIIVTALERDPGANWWKFKARYAPSRGIGFVGEFEVNTRTGWLELEPEPIRGW